MVFWFSCLDGVAMTRWLWLAVLLLVVVDSSSTVTLSAEAVVVDTCPVVAPNYPGTWNPCQSGGCELSLPSTHFTHPTIIPYKSASNEEEQLKNWLKKHDEIEDVFITPKGQADKLKEYGWERVPFTHNGNEIWIQRKPKSDQKLMGESA